MDILKQELLRKQQAKTEKTGGKKWYNRSKVEKQRLQKLREEEKQEAEAKALRQKQNGGNQGHAASEERLKLMPAPKE